MKNLLYTFAIITLVATLTSCTADEIQEPINSTQEIINEQYFQKNDTIIGDIDPPTNPVPNPNPPK